MILWCIILYIEYIIHLYYTFNLIYVNIIFSLRQSHTCKTTLPFTKKKALIHEQTTADGDAKSCTLEG